MKSKSMKVKPLLECGGGVPREIRWVLSGAIDEFYPVGVTMVQVDPAIDDDDFCKYKECTYRFSAFYI